MIEKRDPQRYRRLVEAAQRHADRHYSLYEQLAGIVAVSEDKEEATAPAS